MKEEKVYVTSGKKKASVRRDTRAVSGTESGGRAPKPTPKAASPSNPSMTRGRSASRERSVRGKDHLVSIGILPNVNSVKLNRDANKAGDKVSVPALKVEEQPSKKAEKELSKQKKRRLRCCSDCENCTSVGLCLARIRAIRTSEKLEESVKPEA